MAATTWCTHCQAKLTAKSDAVYGRELVCPKCKQKFSASDVPPDDGPNVADIDIDAAEDLFGDLPPLDFGAIGPSDGLNITDIDTNAAEDDPFGELAPLDSGATTLQPTQIPLEAIPTPREKIGADGLTDSERRYDLIVRIIGYSIIGITVIVWIVVGMRPHEGMSPLYAWIPGSFPALLMGLLIGVYGAVFGDEARRARRKSLVVVGVSLGVILVFGAIIILFPANSKPSAIRGMNAIGAFFVFGVAGIALCLGLAGVLTGQSFWKLLTELGQRV